MDSNGPAEASAAETFRIYGRTGEPARQDRDRVARVRRVDAREVVPGGLEQSHGPHDGAHVLAVLRLRHAREVDLASLREPLDEERHLDRSHARRRALRR